MANIKSAKKRVKQTETKNEHNRYYAKTTRNAIKVLRSENNKEVAVKLYHDVASMLDKLAKINVIHKNKAGNLKSKLTKHINTL